MGRNELKKGYGKVYSKNERNIADAVSTAAKSGTKAGNSLIDQNNEENYKKDVQDIGNLFLKIKIKIEEEAIPLIKKNIEYIVKNKIKTIKDIETNLDSLLNYIDLSLGEKEFKELNKYYSKIHPRNSKQYEKFYNEAKARQ